MVLSRPVSQFVSGMKVSRWGGRDLEVMFADKAEANCDPALSSADRTRIAVEQSVPANRARYGVEKLTLLA